MDPDDPYNCVPPWAITTMAPEMMAPIRMVLIPMAPHMSTNSEITSTQPGVGYGLHPAQQSMYLPPPSPVHPNYANQSGSPLQPQWPWRDGSIGSTYYNNHHWSQPPNAFPSAHNTSEWDYTRYAGIEHRAGGGGTTFFAPAYDPGFGHHHQLLLPPLQLPQPIQTTQRKKRVWEEGHGEEKNKEMGLDKGEVDASALEGRRGKRARTMGAEEDGKRVTDEELRRWLLGQW